jgi:hypothetical protein
VVRRTFSPARAWRPAVGARLARTLGFRTRSMRTLVAFFSTIIAFLVAIQAFVAVFYAPVLVSGDDKILLAWGWIAPLIGIPVAYYAGKSAYRILHDTLEGSLRRNSLASSNFAFTVITPVAIVAAIGWLMWTYGDVNVKWSDEVRFDNGGSALVPRSAKGNVAGRSKAAPTGWLPKEFTVDVASIPGLTGTPVWHSQLRPVLFDKNPSTGSWFLLAEPAGCAAWYELGKPNPPYVMFVPNRNGWHSSQMPLELDGRGLNMLISPRFTSEERVLSAERIQARNDGHRSEGRAVIRSVSRC